ncbi:TRAP transporter large permease [Zhengella sp. ZM62]|uniref:TRAP transporter large permease n=1 Tax=Zhengella sedimenti TaxID=3390035 RepID=UPI0039762940
MSVTIVVFVLLAAFIAIDVPVAIALGAAAVVGGYMLEGNLGFVGSVLFSSLQKIELLAIPFFILAGNVFDRCGIMRRLFELVDSLVGRVRGRTGIVTSGVSVLLGGLSGSGPADTAALGATVGPILRDRGYSGGSAGALISAGGALGLVMPPSIAFILYAVAVPGVSIGEMFVAGLLPGILMGLLIALCAWLIATRTGIDRAEGRLSLRNVARAFNRSILGLGAPIVVVGGIYLGVFTPTEAAGVAVFYGLLVGLVFYREIGIRDVAAIARRTMIDTAVVMFIVACASLFSFVITLDGQVMGWITEFAIAVHSEWQVFLLAGIVLLLAGLVIDGASIYLVIVPLLVPAVRMQGIDLTWFGVFVAVAVAIGQFTPPVGVNLFVAARVLDTRIQEILRGILPFVLVSILALFLIYLFPGLSTWLPSTMPG